MGTGLPGFVELFIVILGLLAIGIVGGAPHILSDWASRSRHNFEKEARQQAELARKLAIAEAAADARRRGETFVPPADYDR